MMVLPCPRQPIDSAARFVVVEGLSAVGKTTVAPMLAEATGAEYLPTLVPSFEETRRLVDRSGLVMARVHFWMMCNYMIADRVRALLRAGRTVVVESYFYRTLATHAAMGVTNLPPVDWRHAVRADVAVLLTVDERVRQERLASRRRDSGGLSYWSRLEESNVDATRRAYEAFDLIPLDTTRMTPAEVVQKLAELTNAAMTRRSNRPTSVRPADLTHEDNRPRKGATHA
jgi:thymidylate kinase